ncbi:MAG: hypothetical protein R2698_05610 [Microthrixaceae bacterium]
MGLFFGAVAPVDHDDARRSVATGAYAPWFHAMLARGIAFAPGPYEVMFPSLSHTDAIIDRTIEAAHDVANELARDRV